MREEYLTLGKRSNLSSLMDVYDGCVEDEETERQQRGKNVERMIKSINAGGWLWKNSTIEFISEKRKVGKWRGWELFQITVSPILSKFQATNPLYPGVVVETSTKQGGRGAGVKHEGKFGIDAVIKRIKPLILEKEKHYVRSIESAKANETLVVKQEALV